MLCAEINPDGTVKLMNPQPETGACLYWIGEGSEIGTLEVPPPETLAEAFGWGFTLVLLSYMVGWAVGTVVNFFNHEKE